MAMLPISANALQKLLMSVLDMQKAKNDANGIHEKAVEELLSPEEASAFLELEQKVKAKEKTLASEKKGYQEKEKKAKSDIANIIQSEIPELQISEEESDEEISVVKTFAYTFPDIGRITVESTSIKDVFLTPEEEMEVILDFFHMFSVEELVDWDMLRLNKEAYLEYDQGQYLNSIQLGREPSHLQGVTTVKEVRLKQFRSAN